MSDVPTAIGNVLASVPDVRRVVFLVGAGLSVKSGFDLWPKATSKALEASKARGLSAPAHAYAADKLAKRDLYGVFGVLKDELTPAAYRSIVLETFAGKNEANDTQKALVSVPARGIITTNFDECLTAARVHVDGETTLSSIREILASSSNYFIAQPHGTIRDFPTMVLTRDDWQRVLREGLLRQLLEQVISQNQLIILGYGMADPDFQHIWQGILAERLFAEPALLCCSTGSLTESQIAEHKSRNVQVVEIDDPDHSFSYIDTLVAALAAKSFPKIIASSAISKKVDELERYVLLCMEFAPDQVTRLELVCRAVLIEQLIASRSSLSEAELVANVAQTLGESSETILRAARVALSSLVADATIFFADGKLSLKEASRKQIEKRVSDADSEEIATLKRVLELYKLPPPHKLLSVEIFQALVDRTFASFGMEVAEFFLYSRPARIPSEKIDEIVNSYCAPLGVDPVERAAYSEAIKSLVIQPDDVCAPVVFKKLQAYFITTAFVLSPTSERLLADYADGHIVYLDASIILPALAMGHPSNALYRSMLSSTIRLGMKLRVSGEMLNEVAHNLRLADKAFRDFSRSSAPLSDVIAGYLVLQGRGNGNVFLEGFATELELDPSITPSAYMRMIVGDISYNDDAVGRMLAERYEIVTDKATEGDFDLSEIAKLTATVAHLRKLGHRYKTELLCRHEALQFALIHLRRKQSPPLASKIWFITTDYFFVELQRLEGAKYPLPVSYTPRLWFQYLNLLDHSARGSKHYSRLQQRMRYGVAIGGLGLTAINQILTEKKKLIEKGIATVQEMAQAIVDEYHVQRSIEVYAFNRRDADGKDDSLAVLSRQVRSAVSKLETIKTREIDRLKEEKDEALQRAARAEKALAKQKYVNRVARPVTRKRTPKKKRR